MKKLFSIFLSLAVACCSPAYAGSLNNINPISLAYATGTLGIAHGGTNGTSFLAPSGGCDPITFYDGTRINTNSVVTDLCYNTTTNTVYTGSLNISAASLTTALFTNTTTTSPTQGAGMQGLADDGAAMNNGDRLGYYTLGGAYNATHSTFNAVAVSGFATENWTTTAHGSQLRLEVTPNGSATRAAKVIVTPSNGTQIVGTTTNDTAGAGNVGEYIEADNSATPIALTSGITATVNSISLSPGDYDVFGVAGAAASGGTISTFSGCGSLTAAACPSAGFVSQIQGIASNAPALPFPTERISVAVTTTVYCNETMAGTGTLTGWCIISARRRR